MSASRRLPTSRFQPGIAAMYALTGASPSAFAICGLPPERRATFPAFRARVGLALLTLLRLRAYAAGSSRSTNRGRFVPGDRGLHKRFERARVDLVPLVDVNRPSRVAFQAG